VWRPIVVALSFFQTISSLFLSQREEKRREGINST
jgi:hypothetical protein